MTTSDYKVVADSLIDLSTKLGPRVWAMVYKEFVTMFIKTYSNFDVVKFDIYVKNGILENITEKNNEK